MKSSLTKCSREEQTGKSIEESKDFLWLHVRELPYFRSLVRAVEARFYQDLWLGDPPILDVGCGDGHFSTVAFAHPLDVGIDPAAKALRQAHREGNYRWVLCCSGDALPFGTGAFGGAVSNSVLEHIADVEGVLAEVTRVLKPGSPLIFCVPNQNFLPSLSIGGFLDRAGAHDLAGWYREFFNAISRHKHCDPPEVWQARLERAGFAIDRWWNYVSPQGLHVVEWGHYFGLPSLLCHVLFGRWIIAPYRWNLAPAMAVVRPSYDEEPVQAHGVYTFYVTHKVRT
jgi:SAM-dependent methyltransferase